MPAASHADMHEAAKADPENASIAAKLRDYADLLEQQGADGFREKAYRRAAETVLKLSRPVSHIVALDGRDGLIALPGIGKGIAGAIAEMVATSRWSQLDRLRGELSPEKLFRTIPGIGPKLAHDLAEIHQLESLEDLEDALIRGEVKLKGFGQRRREAVLALLAERLGRPFVTRPHAGAARPDVGTLLKVDAMYRERAAAGTLRKIAPKRHNPGDEAWLPIMHARHDNWHFTALYSNTTLAHQLQKTRDWVIIYYQAENDGEGRCTVVTESRGPLAGERVVRGRENECAELASITGPVETSGDLALVSDKTGANSVASTAEKAS